ncbi:MAG: hypothetical protein QM820_61615 [Minicystis sp.]
MGLAIQTYLPVATGAPKLDSTSCSGGAPPRPPLDELLVGMPPAPP